MKTTERLIHHCHAYACITRCRPEHLMCATHWRMVPSDLQSEVWKHYRPGQCEDMQPSPEWFVAAETAIAAVATLEGHDFVARVAMRSAHAWNLRAALQQPPPPPPSKLRPEALPPNHVSPPLLSLPPRPSALPRRMD